MVEKKNLCTVKILEMYSIMKTRMIRNVLKEKIVNIKCEQDDQEDEKKVFNGLIIERTFIKNSFNEIVIVS